ncbi:MAG: Smr/MutS family protein [Planctomycetota bacterium]
MAMPLDDALRAACLDLHGCTREQAEASLHEFLRLAQGRGSLTVTVIHGHGTGVLREHVRKLLDAMPDVVADYGPLPPKDGAGVKVRLKGAPAPRRAGGRGDHAVRARKLLADARRIEPPRP